ncbi:hypothetical protein LPU83_pLPU83c_0327 (plasmid) [Rhizobium favelukesii]|uniref:Uncharacterized protein n=1 Tax=Rhizobium favelukesii TaxID=348824 RepID=W6RJ53_9HYPH|nr:hypothetical protein LPU83_pLPU83c_0327 [Rhizobium favelukesii]
MIGGHELLALLGGGGFAALTEFGGRLLGTAQSPTAFTAQLAVSNSARPRPKMRVVTQEPRMLAVSPLP